ncbi:MAG: hypothetical protein ACJ76I_13135 [Gaiellaceae bacterium]
MTSSALRTAGTRLAGERPSRARAATAAAVAGTATGVAVYRWLRRDAGSGYDEQEAR